MILGITGGTGCGKTTLLQEIKARGGMILDCDEIYHELLERDERLLCAIETRFPGVAENGMLNRKKLGKIVFSNEKALLELNQITHSAVKAEVQRRLAGNPELAAIDAIALFEGGLASLCDRTVAVTAPLEDRVQRLQKRDGISEEYARARIAAQKPESYFTGHCDRVIRNDGSRESFEQACHSLVENLLNE